MSNPIDPQNNNGSSRMNRRRFLHGTGAGIALFHIGSSRLIGAENFVKANNRIGIAGIGIGSQGGREVLA